MWADPTDSRSSRQWESGIALAGRRHHACSWLGRYPRRMQRVELAPVDGVHITTSWTTLAMYCSRTRGWYAGGDNRNGGRDEAAALPAAGPPSTPSVAQTLGLLVSVRFCDPGASGLNVRRSP